MHDLDPELSGLFRQIELVIFDFDGVFTDNSVYVAEDGTETVRCSRADGLGLAKLAEAGVRSMVLSTETNPVVSARSRKLGIACTQGCPDKGAELKQVAAKLGLALQAIAYVGNDVNDLGCLELVGLPIVVADAHADVLPHARYQTRKPGGNGAVREVCDLIFRVKSAAR